MSAIQINARVWGIAPTVKVYTRGNTKTTLSGLLLEPIYIDDLVDTKVELTLPNQVLEFPLNRVPPGAVGMARFVRWMSVDEIPNEGFKPWAEYLQAYPDLGIPIYQGHVQAQFAYRPKFPAL